ncbi:MAG: hypothetical protein IKQ46_10540 [Bacteroidales bacterium]|nr:hypothetical protein [Bacteroidales bacterium]
MMTPHRRADRILLNDEKRIDDYYNKQKKRIVNIFDEFYKNHKDEFEQAFQDYKDGKITKDEYKNYLLNMTTLSSEWRTTADKIVDEITRINKTALYRVVSRNLKKIYIDNYNTTIKVIGGELLGD